MPSTAIAPSPTACLTTGGRLIGLDGRVLPLKGASLTADAKGGLIRVTLAQTFSNAYDEPLRVTYSVPLPADGAVSGFSFRIGDKRIVGEVDTKKQARQRFEDAIIEGRTAAILDQERSSLFTQEVGNIPPRTEVVCEVVIDQKLAWLPDGCWEWRFPTVIAPRYLGETGRVADCAKVTVDVADQALPVKLSLSLSIRDQLPDAVRPESPSHSLHTARGLQRIDVTLADERGAGLDRDVVVRWRVSGQTVGTSIDTVGRTVDQAFGLVTLVPPTPEAPVHPLARDLIVLLDTSGSMSGMPLDQARRVTSALIDSLTANDQLELIEFSNAPRRWRSGAVVATPEHRREAQAWLSQLRASGGTEMRLGILEALRGLRVEAQRQVVLITDGLIGSEHEVLQAIAHQLPTASRVHVIGVGSSVNRSLTAPAARAGRGVEFIVGLGEDAEIGVKRLLARTTAPLVTELSISGSAVREVSPQRLPDLYAGAPALLSVKLDPRGGELVIRGITAAGPLEERLTVPAVHVGEGSRAIATLFARELVEDLEQNRVIEGTSDGFDARIEQTGLEFQISTRLTSWVAVSELQTVDPRSPRRTEVQPQSPVYGLSAEGLGLRRAAAPLLVGAPASRSRALAGPSGRVADDGASKGADGFVAYSQFERVSTDESEPSFAAKESPAGTPPPTAGASQRPSELGFAAAADVKERGSPGGAPPPPAAANPSPRLSEAQLADEETVRQEESPVGAPPPPSPKAVPPAPAEKKKSVGLKDLVRRAFGVSEGLKTLAPLRRLLGALISLTNRRLVARLRVDSVGLTWAPEGTARVELADGSMLDATVNLSLTTAAGSYSEGLDITLVLDLPGPALAPKRLHLVNNGETTELSL